MLKTLFTSSLLVASGLASAAPENYAVDPAHTVVTFEILHGNMSTHRGHFDAKEGTVVLDREARTGKVDVTIDTTSISTGVPALDGHLKGKDFFNAAEFPTAKFTGDKLAFDGNKLSSVSGTLTMLGKTLPVTLTATSFNCYESPQLKREVCGGDFETTIARSQWGVSYGLTYGIPDNVRLLIQVEAVKQ